MFDFDALDELEGSQSSAESSRGNVVSSFLDSSDTARDDVPQPASSSPVCVDILLSSSSVAGSPPGRASASATSPRGHVQCQPHPTADSFRLDSWHSSLHGRAASTDVASLSSDAVPQDNRPEKPAPVPEVTVSHEVEQQVARKAAAQDLEPIHFSSPSLRMKRYSFRKQDIARQVQQSAENLATSCAGSTSVAPGTPLVHHDVDVGDNFQTISKVLMRRGEELESESLGWCPPECLMQVLEVPASKNSRRVRVLEEHGVEGWVSLAKQCGTQLLRRHMPTGAERIKLLRAGKAAEGARTKAASSAANGHSSETCDKCDGPHATDSCPFFKSAREDHKDSWVHYGDKNPHKMGGEGGNFVLRHARVVKQPGDGSCLFHSLSFGLLGGCGGHGAAQQLRLEIARFIESHQDLEIAGDTVEEWVKWDQNTSAVDYARRMAHSGWGGGIDMACCAVMKSVDVHVYESTQNADFKRISCFNVPHPKQTVHVLYQGGVHYDALVPLHCGRSVFANSEE